MMFIKAIFAVTLAVLALAAPPVQPRQSDGSLVDVDALVDDVLNNADVNVLD